MTGTLTLNPGWVLPDADHLAVALATTMFAPVFPCLPDKKPATAHGFHDATTDEDTIRYWWGPNPTHLVGIPTAGLIVVDLDDDPRHPCTWTWWQHLCDRHGWVWHRDVLVFTPGNGVHVYFEQPAGVEIRNSASKLAPGVDIRATGGYVIAPGSVLPDGRRYELVNNPEGTHVAPGWLVDLIHKATSPPARPAERREATTTTGDSHGTRYGLAGLESEAGRLALAVDGARNDTLLKAAIRAGQLVAGDQLDERHAVETLYTVALRIGLTETETVATIQSGIGRGLLEPRRPQR